MLLAGYSYNIYVSSKKYPTVYAFIDSQNLNLGTSKSIYRNGNLLYKGWKLDMQSFRKYLLQKFRVSRAFLFLGYIPQNKGMYKKFKKFGYEIIFKPTVRGEGGKPKGNIDAEMVLYSAAVLFEEYEKGIFVSGDGDFYCLYKFMEEKGKLGAILIPNMYTQSKLLGEFEENKKQLFYDKDLLREK